MRTILSSVIHHSVTPIDQEHDKTLKSFNRTHAMRMAGQPNGGTEWPSISYHYSIFQDGKVYLTRQLDKVGWHASKYNINATSVGICLVGNFDTDTLPSAMNDSLISLLRKLKATYPTMVKVYAHREFAPKSCPGNNISDAYIATLNNALQLPEPTAWYKPNPPEVQLKQALSALPRSKGVRKWLLKRKIQRLTNLLQ